jgi:predicted LPLAT superfamily acyltransferase
MVAFARLQRPFGGIDLMPGWLEQRERGSRWAVRIILWIALHLGRPSARVLLHPITLYFLLTAGPQRRASRSFLSRALGRRATVSDIAKHIHAFSATILDRVYLLAGRRQELDVRVHQGEVVRRRMESGQGFLLLGSHLGSFEVLRALAREEIGMPLKILMDPVHNPAITEIFHALSPAALASVISLAGPQPLLAVKESLDAGYVVGLLGDRRLPGEAAVRCDFLGDTALFPASPITLAALTGVPVVLTFGLYRGGNRYDVFFEELSDRIRVQRRRIPGCRDPSLERWVQAYADRLAFYTRSAPYNWFNFYDFWEQVDGSGQPH